jgi:hypothetical protein
MRGELAARRKLDKAQARDPENLVSQPFRFYSFKTVRGSTHQQNK